MHWRHFWAVTKKEIRHIWRDRTTFLLVTLMPTVLLFLMAYALTADIDHVPVAALDLDRSPTSRAFLQQMTVGDDLDLVAMFTRLEEVEAALLRGEIKAAMILPPTFEHDLLALEGMPLQILVDGTEPQGGGFAVDHIGRRAETFALERLTHQLRSRGVGVDTLNPVDMRVRIWYNPDLKASADLVPGLVSLVLGLPGMSVALTMAREREHGTLEQLLASPLGRASLLLGKMAPYVLGGLVNVVLTVALAILWFGVPFHGDFLLFLGLSLVYLFALLGLGMLVGVFIRTQAAALALTMLVVFFPGFFLTGIFFPIVSMPPIVRLESMGFPGTHYAIITRASFITGVGLDVLWVNGVALFGLGMAFTGVAALFFRKKLG